MDAARARALRSLALFLPLFVFVWGASGRDFDAFSDKVSRTCIPKKIRRPSVQEMTLEEKVGQMTQVQNKALWNPDDITKYHIGSVLSGGGGSPNTGNRPKDWADMVDSFQSKALKTRLSIPIVYGVDAVHGHNNLYGATIFPHHVGLGATKNPSLVKAISAAVAKEVVGTGIRWVFAPTVAVCQNPRWGRCYESFSDRTKLVQAMTTEINGWQEKPKNLKNVVAGSTFVAACAKHYVGDGGTEGGKDQGNTVMSQADLFRIHLPPYVDAISRKVSSIMVSFNSWNGLKMHANKYLITDVLKGSLGFKGVVLSDWQAINQIPGSYSDQVRTSINAGLDMIMVPDAYQDFISTLINLVRSGSVKMSRINDAVTRILNMKQRIGAFDNPCASRTSINTIGSPAHRSLARRAVRESLVLLKNRYRASGRPVFPLPNKKGIRILVTGTHANDIGLQCGGWTITWQGSAGNITIGTTILQGILSAVGKTAKVNYVPRPSGSEKADYALIFVGESPYAEFFGDKTDLNLGSSKDLISTVCRRMKCIVVLISGRPLEIYDVLPNVDAFIAAWLPGTEGNGISDMLFSKKYDFKGTLPRNWFKKSTDLNKGVRASPLFPYGYGLNKAGKRI